MVYMTHKQQTTGYQEQIWSFPSFGKIKWVVGICVMGSISMQKLLFSDKPVQPRLRIQPFTSVLTEEHLTFSDSSSICQAHLGTCFLTFLQPTHKGFKIWAKRKIVVSSRRAKSEHY